MRGVNIAGMMTTLALLGSLLLSGCERPPVLWQQESYVFGTRVQITTADAPESVARPAVSAALADLDRWHVRLHAWRDDSELTRINRALAEDQWTRTDPEVFALLSQAQQMSSASEGLFNPAIGQLVALWGFHADSFAPVTPNPAALRRLIASAPQMSDVQLDGGQVRSRNRKVSFDLGGMAKGWALDRVADRLRQAGVKSALINIGGNILALGSKGDTPWKVGLQAPRDNQAMAVIVLHDGEALGTSGDYQRYFELDGVRYCHLIDPRNGSAACQRQAATVLVEPGPDAGLRSDVASKPLFFAPRADIARLAGRFAIRDVLLVEADGHTWLSPAMQPRVQWLQRPAQVDVLTGFAEAPT